MSLFYLYALFDVIIVHVVEHHLTLCIIYLVVPSSYCNAYIFNSIHLVK